MILHTHNEKVDLFNEKKLSELNERAYVFKAEDTGTDEAAVRQLEKDCVSPGKLTLKIGARVMCTKNIDDQICNGSTGTVCAIMEPNNPRLASQVFVDWDGVGKRLVVPAEWEILDTGSRDVLARRKQFPLRLAWAITIHKSQGMTLQSAQAYLKDCFTPGQVYVALSRLVSSENLTIASLSASGIRVDRKALAFYDNPNDPTHWGAKVEMKQDPLEI